MPTKRAVLDLLARDDLVAVADRFQIEVTDRRAKAALLDAIASSKKATLPEILAAFTRDGLKLVCRGLGLDDSGK
ncbi:MAG: SAM-dependent DNA methyltransferase, partial [Deltaproteobacteria bacterium]|nr:SAM-dependent DNA methyltransferase [Deltaproteobacteria bacterium]